MKKMSHVDARARTERKKERKTTKQIAILTSLACQFYDDTKPYTYSILGQERVPASERFAALLSPVLG